MLNPFRQVINDSILRVNYFGVFFEILFRTIRSSNAIRLSSINAKQSPVGEKHVFNCKFRFNSFQITANIPKGIWKLGKLNHIAVAVPNIGNDESN